MRTDGHRTSNNPYVLIQIIYTHGTPVATSFIVLAQLFLIWRLAVRSRQLIKIYIVVTEAVELSYCWLHRFWGPLHLFPLHSFKNTSEYSDPFTNSDMFLLLVLLFSLICVGHAAKGPCLMPQQGVHCVAFPNTVHKNRYSSEFLSYFSETCVWWLSNSSSLKLCWKSRSHFFFVSCKGLWPDELLCHWRYGQFKFNVMTVQ